MLDFGLAKVVSDQDSMAPVTPANSPTISVLATQAGIILGTAAYMAPEQAKGKQVDRRADIWAFGCVLFEMLSGKKAFDGETISDVLASVLKSEPDWSALPADTPPAIKRLIRRCLQKDVRQRLQAIGDARIAIEETLSGTAADAEGAISASRIPEAKRSSLLHRALPWTLGAVAVICAAVAGWLLLKPQPQPNVFRFAVAPPENMVFIAGGEISISPDGRMLAFVAQAEAGTNKPTALWLRPLDGLTAQPIPGTEGAVGPFWSPDGQQIGFRANGKLEKISVQGGTPQTLCDAISFGGATWNRDGVILFGNEGGFYRVPDTGGTPTLVLAPEPSQNYWFPQFLPDGKHFIFNESGEVSEGSFIEAGSLDSKTAERLVQGNSQAVFSPPGYLFYVDRTTLIVRPFDASALRFTGPAVPVAQGIASTLYSNFAYFSVSAAGVLAYQAAAEVTSNQMTWFNRAGEKLGTVGQPSFYTAPALSADGARLGVAVGWFGKRDIWVYDLKRGTASRLTFNPADDTNTAWSADDSRIVFSSNRAGQFDIYQKAANGLGSEQPVFQSKQEKHVDDLSSDGRYAIYDTAAGNTQHTELWGLPLFGDRKPFPFVQSNFNAICAQFSPNGRYVAYASTETGNLEVYVQTFPEHVGKWQISATGGNEPVWSRDGKELFYLDLDGKLMEVDVNTNATFQAAIPKPLFQTQLNGRYPGRTMYVVSPDAQRFLMIVPAGTAKPEPLTVVVNWPSLLRHGSSK